nr:bombyxin B-10-like [Onthophagus taurus]
MVFKFLLVISVFVSFVSSEDVYQACGDRLDLLVSSVCSKYYRRNLSKDDDFDSSNFGEEISSSRTNRMLQNQIGRRQIVSACCFKPCTVRTIEEYCHY